MIRAWQVAPCLALAWWLAGSAAAVHAQATPPLTYEDHVRPLLRKHCVACHSRQKTSADLDLSSYEALMEGGRSGSAVEPGSPDESLLYLLAAHEEEPAMPPGNRRLDDQQLTLLRDWIAQGALARHAATASLSAGAPPNAPTPPTAQDASSPTKFPLGPVLWGPRRNAAQAVACCTARGLVAVAGQRQVLLYRVGATDAPAGDFTSSLVGVLPFPEGQVNALRFSADGRRLLAAGGEGGDSGCVVLWDAEAGARIARYGAEPDALLCCDLSPDGKFLIAGGPQRELIVWDVETGDELARVEKHADWLLAVAFSPEGLLLASADRSGGVYVWETASRALLHTLPGHQGAVGNLAWSADGDLCVTGGEDGQLRMWNMHDGALVRQWSAHPGGILSLDASHEWGLLTSGRDLRIQRWSWNGAPSSPAASSGEELPLQARHVDATRSIIGQWDGVVRLHDWQSRPAAVLEPPPEWITDDVTQLPAEAPTPQLAARPRATERTDNERASATLAVAPPGATTAPPPPAQTALREALPATTALAAARTETARLAALALALRRLGSNAEGPAPADRDEAAALLLVELAQQKAEAALLRARLREQELLLHDGPNSEDEPPTQNAEQDADLAVESP